MNEIHQFQGRIRNGDFSSFWNFNISEIREFQFLFCFVFFRKKKKVSNFFQDLIFPLEMKYLWREEFSIGVLHNMGDFIFLQMLCYHWTLLYNCDYRCKWASELSQNLVGKQKKLGGGIVYLSLALINYSEMQHLK